MPQTSDSSQIDISQWKKDGFPFFYEREQDNLLLLWESLSEKQMKNEKPDLAGFISLERQSRAYKGRLIQIEGRLLRTQFIAVSTEKSEEISEDNAENRGEEILLEENGGKEGEEEGIKNQKNQMGGDRDGYYESWVLLDDQRRIPARLITRRIPEGVTPDSALALDSNGENSPKPALRRERIQAIGIYYRQASYNAGDDFYNAPVIIAEDFQVLSGGPASGREDEKTPSSVIYYKTAAILFLFLLWIFLRFFVLRKRSTRKIPSLSDEEPGKDFRFSPEELALLQEEAQKTTLPDSMAEKAESAAVLSEGTESNDSKPDSSVVRHLGIPFILLAAMTLNAENPAENSSMDDSKAPAAASYIDAQFWEEITGIDAESVFQAKSEEDISASDVLLPFFNRIQNNLTPGFFYRQIPEEIFAAESPKSFAHLFTPDEENLEGFIADWPNQFGAVLPFYGTIQELREISLPQQEKTSLTLLERFYRLQIRTARGKSRMVYALDIPKRWKENPQAAIGEATGGVGVYFWRIPEAQKMVDEESISEDSANNASEADLNIPLLLAKRIGRYSDQSELGRLGFDLSLLDAIPALPVSALSSADPKDRQKILENFKLTAKDRYPFYELLAAVSGKSPCLSEIFKKGDEKDETAESSEPAEKLGTESLFEAVPPLQSAVDLFNRPDEWQGKRVEFTGHLRRARKVIVSDPEIQELYQIDHYYELYLFTQDSQQYPILFCVPEVPEDMPLGTGKNYRQEVKISGYFYKPWAYSIDEVPEDSPLLETAQGSHWITVPLVIGSDFHWFREESAQANAPMNSLSKWTFAFFTVILGAALFYFICRPKRKSIQFQIGPKNPPILPQ